MNYRAIRTKILAVIFFGLWGVFQASAYSAALTRAEISEIKQAALYSLKDPGSAKFRKIQGVGNGACAEVNAKNSYGEYAGFRTMYLKKRNGVWKKFSSDDNPFAWCIEYMSKPEP